MLPTLELLLFALNIKQKPLVGDQKNITIYKVQGQETVSASCLGYLQSNRSFGLNFLKTIFICPHVSATRMQSK